MVGVVVVEGESALESALAVIALVVTPALALWSSDGSDGGGCGFLELGEVEVLGAEEGEEEEEEVLDPVAGEGMTVFGIGSTAASGGGGAVS